MLLNPPPNPLPSSMPPPPHPLQKNGDKRGGVQSFSQTGLFFPPHFCSCREAEGRVRSSAVKGRALGDQTCAPGSDRGDIRGCQTLTEPNLRASSLQDTDVVETTPPLPPPPPPISLIPMWLSAEALLHCRHNYLVKVNR